MKDLVKILSKPIVLAVIAFLGAALLSYVLVMYLIFPRFNTYQEMSEKNAEDSNKLSVLRANVASFERLDKAQIASYEHIIGDFVPDSPDVLQFLTVNEAVAAASQVTISGIQVITAKAAPTTPAAPSPSGGANLQSSKGLIPAAFAQAAPTPLASSSTRSYSVKVSVAGNYPQIVKYLDNLKKTDRLLGIAAVSITGSDGGTSAIVTVDLALGSTNITVSPEDSIVITNDEKDLLNNLGKGVLFTPVPANSGLGRSDPFN